MIKQSKIVNKVVTLANYHTIYFDLIMNLNYLFVQYINIKFIYNKKHVIKNEIKHPQTNKYYILSPFIVVQMCLFLSHPDQPIRKSTMVH